MAFLINSRAGRLAPGRLLKALPARACALVFALVLALAFQLLASTQHKHDLATHAPDCASCLFASELPPDIPTGHIDAIAGAAGFCHRILPPIVSAFVAQQRFLIPHAQGPPPIFRAA